MNNKNYEYQNIIFSDEEYVDRPGYKHRMLQLENGSFENMSGLEHLKSSYTLEQLIKRIGNVSEFSIHHYRLTNILLNKLIKNLPPTIKKLKINCGEDINLDLTYIPETIESIWFLAKSISKNTIDALPINLKKIIFSITLDFSLDNLPPGLETLIVHNPMYPLDNLPNTLKTLIINGIKLNIDLNNLPDSIENIYIDKRNLNKLTKIPQKLTTLYIIIIHSLMGNIDNDEYKKNIPGNVKIQELYRHVMSYKFF